MDITPGSTVRVKITAVPRNAAASKTLTRVFRKDVDVVKHLRRRKQHRPSLQTWQRGGRMWRHRMKSHAPIQIEPGAQYTVQATVDVIRDLMSVERYIDVTAA